MFAAALNYRFSRRPCEAPHRPTEARLRRASLWFRFLTPTAEAAGESSVPEPQPRGFRLFASTPWDEPNYSWLVAHNKQKNRENRVP